MWSRTSAWVIVLLAVSLHTCTATWYGIKKSTNGDPTAGERCFCQLKGVIDDCSCSVETLDSFNNLKLYPRLNSLLQYDYFRYWKVNLNKKCPFWEDDSKCAIRYCSVKPCTDVPEGIKGASIDRIEKAEKKKSHMTGHCDGENDLGYLNTTLSKESQVGFKRWAAHDDAQLNFCKIDDDSSEDSEYVDLLLNPERYTGYAGPSAHRIWRSIYQENCFKPSRAIGLYTDFSSIGANDFLKEMCLEKRTFYRAISGLHTSINIHLSANYLLSDKNGFDVSKEGQWGPNVEEFQKRFDPELTGGEGPHRLKNLYFVYLLELRALAKAAPYLESLEYYTGNESEDKDVLKAVEDLLTVVKSFPEHFDESSMFSGGQQATKLKEEFRQHFWNVSRIMDCVGCDKCRLWGKLQVTGLGTALKILFSGNLDQQGNQKVDITAARQSKFQLSRIEIVALFNAFGRLSRSIVALENFRQSITRR
ncbi:ero1-like protein isoform X3 [Penaeus japonicus]|uniref:ero1-like protein isoform X3 n=1 Tax=Penaeus japonicus TaxID=27405 RepID=UPI001C70BD17|nr:ero1-like protein isoform X3 [Penaeus japonicus]